MTFLGTNETVVVEVGVLGVPGEEIGFGRVGRIRGNRLRPAADQKERKEQ
jgi:hypothetical protein